MRIDQGVRAKPKRKTQPITAGPKGNLKNLAAAERRVSTMVAQAKSKPAPTAPRGDSPSTRAKDFKRADTFKKTPTYRAASRAAYRSATIPQRHAVLVKAATKASTEGSVAARVHNDRAAQDAKSIAKYGWLPRTVYGGGQHGRDLARLSAKVDNTAVRKFSRENKNGVPIALPERVSVPAARISANKIPKVDRDKILAQLAQAQSGPINTERTKSALSKILGGAGGGTKSSVLWALRQLSRPSSALGSVAATDAAARDNLIGGGANVKDLASAAAAGFLHPEEHARDWNDAMRSRGIKNKYANEAAALTASVATDPLTFITAGGGTIAKKAAMEAYEKSLAAGATEAAAVKAARVVWDAAPESQKAAGVKVGVRGLPAIALSRGRTTHLETKPIGGTLRAATRKAGRKVGVSDVRVMGVRPATARNLANKVAPTVRPEGWDQLDWAFARRAARKTRAGEREAQRHAAYRLSAYKTATKGWTPEEHALLRKHVEAKDVARLPDKLRPVGEQIERELGHAQSQLEQIGLRPPIEAGSRVGAGTAPKIPQFTTKVNSSHVALERREVTKAIARYTTALKKAGYESGRRGTVPMVGKSLGQDAADLEVKNTRQAVKDATANYHEVKAMAGEQRDAMGAYSKAFAKWQKAPAGFYPRSLAPETLVNPVGQAGSKSAERIAERSRKYTDAMEFMDPEQVAKYENRTPVTMAQYILKHGRKVNLSNLNQRIGALGKEVSVHPDDVGDLAGQKLELFAENPTGLHPLFDKEGLVDKEALTHAVDNGHRIVEVDRGLAERTRSMARGQRGTDGMPPSLAMAAHGLDEKDQTGVMAGYDRLQRRIKVLQTSVNPAYHIVNAIGDSFNAVIGGARPGDFAAGKRLRKIESALKQADLELDPMNATGRLHKANPLSRATKKILDDARQSVDDYGRNGKLSDLDVVKLGVSHGALRTGLTSGELRAASRGASIDAAESRSGRAMERLQNVSDWREDLVRLTTFRSALKRGMSPDDAADWATKHHFDYADLSPIEQKFFRRVIPFWTFTARNTPLQVRSLAARPGVYATEEKARNQSADTAGLPANFSDSLREFEQTGAPWGTPLKMLLKDTKVGHIKAPITLYPKLPFMDLANIPFPQMTSKGQFAEGATFKEAGMNWLNRVTPLAKIPLEQVTGMNLFTGAPQKDLVQAPSWLPKELSRPMQDPRTGKMVRGVSWRLLQVMQSVPATNMLSRQGTSTLHGQPEAGNLKWAGWLAGPRPAIQDPRVVKINQLFEQRDKLTHENELLKPTVHHVRGEDWGGKIRKNMDAITKINNRIYELSERTGAANPAGVPPAKPKRNKQGIGTMGGGNFKAGKGGASMGGGFK